MTSWAGTDQMRSIKRRGHTSDEPAHFSVHLVDDNTPLSRCGHAEAAALTRLATPWPKWSPIYRCRDCNALKP